jgi:hypothetical protein
VLGRATRSDPSARGAGEQRWHAALLSRSVPPNIACAVERFISPPWERYIVLCLSSAARIKADLGGAA